MPSYSKVCPDANFVVNGLRQAGRHATEISAQWELWAGERTRFIVPRLILFEVTNVFYQLQRGGKMSQDEASAFVDAAIHIPFEFVDSLEIHREAQEIARTFGLKATYDAHYVAVARREKMPLVTSDRRLVDALEDGYIETILIPFVDVYE